MRKRLTRQQRRELVRLSATMGPCALARYARERWGLRLHPSSATYAVRQERSAARARQIPRARLMSLRQIADELRVEPKMAKALGLTRYHVGPWCIRYDIEEARAAASAQKPPVC